MTIKIILALFVGCLITTTALVPLVMGFARRIGAVDRGGFRKFQRGQIPLLGGLSIAVPLLVLGVLTGVAGRFIVINWKWLWLHHREFFNPLFSMAGTRANTFTIVVGGVAIIALGIIDDTRGIRARWKLLGQVCVGAFVCAAGYKLTAVALPFWGPVKFSDSFGGFLTVLWVVGLINAFNLIDGIDGLASGIAFVGAVALVVLSLLQDNPYITFVGAALAGSLLGFLFYNFPPAKVFLGDTGSMFIGYCLAMMSLMGAQKTEAAVIVFAPMLALSLPIFETFVSILRRYVRGVPIFAGDNHHTHHRLLSKGFSQPRVVLTLCATGVFLAGAAILSAVISEDSNWAWSPYALYIGTLVYIAWLAGYLRPTTLKTVLERRHRNQLFQALGHYGALRLNSSGDSAVKRKLLLELCRHELGLKHIEIQSGGKELMASSDETNRGSTEPKERLNVKSCDGEDIIIFYEFMQTPDHFRRQDVSLCLAAIFDGMRISQMLKGKEVAIAPQ